MAIKVHKVEILVVDHDEVGAEELKVIIENQRWPNRCIDPSVMSIETKEIEWSDEHPLNQTSTFEAAYLEIFGEGGAGAE